LKDGEEGLIIKSPVGEWVNKKPDYQIKMKTEFSVDLQVVEVLSGKKGGKFQNTTGSILCKSICGKLECKATGFELDSIRHELWERKEELEQGAIIEVKSNGITSNSKGTFSLLNPICKGERIDKSKADNLFEIEASLEGSYYE
jgi:DNA ligase-1